MAPIVAVIALVAALAAVGALVVFGVRRLSRHWSRTREQANVVFAMQLGVIGAVQAAEQRCEAFSGDGQSGPGGGAPWLATHASARAAVLSPVGLVQDRGLRQLTRDLLDCTGRVVATSEAGEAARLRSEVDVLHRDFKVRSVEVVRTLRLRGLSGGR